MLLESTGLFEARGRRRLARRGPPLPVLGTCAGLVLVAREVLDGRPDQRTFGVLDAVVRRNGYGRQEQSFESRRRRSGPVRARRCRPSSSGPRWSSRWGTRSTCWPRWTASPCWCARGTVLASSFHPELTPDRRVHRLFARMCGGPTTPARSARVAVRHAPLRPHHHLPRPRRHRRRRHGADRRPRRVGPRGRPARRPADRPVLPAHRDRRRQPPGGLRPARAGARRSSRWRRSSPWSGT